MSEENIDVLKRIWSRQLEFDKHFLPGIEHLSPEEKQKHTKERILYIVGELMDLIENMDWKTHRKKSSRLIESNIKTELIDIFKYWTGVCLIWGFKPEDIVHEWERKSDVVEQLWKQEFSDPWDSKKYKYMAIVDIDGVLADWEAGFAKFIKERTGIQIEPINVHDLHGHVARHVGLEKAYELKHSFREEGVEAGGLEAIDGASSFLRRMKLSGAYILLMTSRPYNQYKRLIGDTLRWLRDKDMAFNAIIFDEKKEERIFRDYGFARFVVEDLLSNANRIASKGINVFLKQTGYNQGETKPGIVRFRTFKDLEEILWRT